LLLVAVAGVSIALLATLTSLRAVRRAGRAVRLVSHLLDQPITDTIRGAPTP